MKTHVRDFLTAHLPRMSENVLNQLEDQLNAAISKDNPHPVWVKASERNPKKYENYHVKVKGKFGNTYDTTVIFGNGKWYYECKEGDPVIEWLDESGSASGVWTNNDMFEAARFGGGGHNEVYDNKENREQFNEWLKEYKSK